MGIVNAAVIRAISTTLRGEFTSRLAELTPKSFAELVATVVPSTTAQNVYGLLGKFPRLREWQGARVIKSISAAAYTILNKHYESTLGVSVDDIEDDTLGMYPKMSAAEAEAVLREWNEQIALLMSGGTAMLCYDGQNFFDTDHPIYANEDGTGAVTPVSNYATGANPAWYLLDLSGVIKPFIRQERKKPVFKDLTNPDSDQVFMNNQVLFGIDYRGSYGHAFWQQAYRSELALNTANFAAARAAWPPT